MRYEHGTVNAYINDRCRCPDCTEAQRLKMAAWRKARAMRLPYANQGSVGTQRRVEALQWQGWSLAQISQTAGKATKQWAYFMSWPDGRVTRENAALVERVFETLSALPPPQGRAANRVRADARRRGFAPAAAFDDIDDPYEHPKGVAA